MPKKKAKSTKSSSRSHGELFDKHPNLIWLLPIFLIVAAIAVIAYKNSLNPVMMGDMLNADQIPSTLNSSPSAETPEY